MNEFAKRQLDGYFCRQCAIHDDAFVPMSNEGVMALPVELVPFRVAMGDTEPIICQIRACPVCGHVAITEQEDNHGGHTTDTSGDGEAAAAGADHP